MYPVDLDLVLHFVPVMAETAPGIRLTRSFELPFTPTHKISVYSRSFEGLEDPVGYRLKNITWDLDRERFLAETDLLISGVPIGLIPHEIRYLTKSGWTFGSYNDSYCQKKERGRKGRKLARLAISKWDDEEVSIWETNRSGRPEEFKTVWHAVISTLASLCNNCHFAFAMLRTGTFADIQQDRKAPLAPYEERFQKAIQDYETLTFEKQWEWRGRVARRYPKLSEVVAAIR